ncbi:MAG TPA: 1-acyl-sn-glycerol-3-phosphate acyltransferase [Chitinophagaceae bacterium]|nr:1-acyl-sn-glycerol-3-phosphate acyltransferase [Chitinophagaceae bacterium]
MIQHLLRNSFRGLAGCSFEIIAIFTQKVKLLYHFLKIAARFAIRIFCRKIIINKPELLKIKGPLLLACNHPNSFLDSIILDTLFERPVWSLARGDVFKKSFYTRLLTALKILPVYRPSEGVENLSENYKTFEDCIDIFKQEGLVTIFSEGKCINEWHLRPLKKGTARLAIKAWEEQIPLRVLPVGINYSSFRRFGKNIFLNFGETIVQAEINMNEADGLRHQSFNNKLQLQLQQLVYEIPKENKPMQRTALLVKQSPLKKILFFLPAIMGWLVHFPLYLPVKNYTWKRTSNNDHFDSVMTGILFVTYPFYLFILTAVAGMITPAWWVAGLLLFIPFTAWSYVQLKPQLDK